MAGLSHRLILACAIAIPAGCGGDRPAAVVVDGSSTLFPLNRAAQEGFYREVASDLPVVVESHGSSGGFGRYLRGEIDLFGASRPAQEVEVAASLAAGRPWARFILGYDGVTVVVHPSNRRVASLSLGDLRRALEVEGGAATWADLAPASSADPGGKVPIRFYTPDQDSGTYQFLRDRLFGASPPPVRRDAEAHPDDHALVRGVMGDPDALGYFGYDYYRAYRRDRQGRERLRAVPLSAVPGTEAVAPSEATILDRSYPLARPLFLYVRADALARTEVRRFVTYYLENLPRLARLGACIPPTESDLRANAARLRKVLDGDPDGAGGEDACESL